jgi:RNA polymerase sigma factor (sigma-70 family)
MTSKHAPPEPVNRVSELIARPDGLAAIVRVIRSVHRLQPSYLPFDDLLQSTVARALASQDGFRGKTDSELLAWLRVIAANILTDEARRIGRVNPLVESADIPDPRTSPTKGITDRDSVAGILAHLTPFEAALLRTRYEHGLTSDQIAAVLGQSPAAIRQALSRLIRRLRDVTSPGSWTDTGTR